MKRATSPEGGGGFILLWDEFSTYGDVILETDGATGSLMTRYLVGEELIGQVRSTPQAEVRFYLEDALGSTRLLVDNIGTIVETFEYDAYGQLTAGNASLTDYLYTGQRHDAMTGHYHLRAQQYDPSLGRFMGMDTWPLDYDYPVELNRYVYAAGNPTTYVDPSGHTVNLSYGNISQNSLRTASVLANVGYRVATYFAKTAFAYVRKVAAASALDWVGQQFDILELDPTSWLARAMQIENALARADADVIEDVDTDDDEQRLKYVTYILTHPITGQQYGGYTSGYGDPQIIANRRYSSHHKKSQGFGPPDVDKWIYATLPRSQHGSDPSYYATRGREQQLVDSLGGAQSDGGTAGNDIRPVSKNHSKGRIYFDASNAAFGTLWRYTGN